MAEAIQTPETPDPGPGIEAEAGAAASAEAEGRPQQGDNRSDYLGRIRNEPDFAVDEVRKLKSELDKTRASTSQLGDLHRAVELIGQGDVGSGAQVAYQRLLEYSNLLSDRKAAAVIERFRETGRWPGVEDDYLGSEPEPEDPKEAELRSLRDTVQRLEGRSAQVELRSHLDSFFGSDPIGSVLDAEEKKEVFTKLESQFRTWAGTDMGRAQLRNMTQDTVATIVTDHLRRTGKLLEVAERSHLRKLDKRKGAATDGPSGVSSSGAEPAEFKNVKDALLFAAKKYGVDLG